MAGDMEKGGAKDERNPLLGAPAEVLLQRLHDGLQPNKQQQYRAVGGLLEDDHFIQVTSNSARLYAWWRARSWLLLLLSLLPLVPPLFVLYFVLHLGDVSKREGSIQERQALQLHIWFVLGKVAALAAVAMAVASALVGGYIAWVDPQYNVPQHAAERVVATVRYCLKAPLPDLKPPPKQPDSAQHLLLMILMLQLQQQQQQQQERRLQRRMSLYKYPSNDSAHVDTPDADGHSRAWTGDCAV